MYSKEIFDQDCRQCKRLDDFLCEVKQQHPSYHARPVAPFGDNNAKLLIVGLAPVCMALTQRGGRLPKIMQGFCFMRRFMSLDTVINQSPSRWRRLGA